jgi:cbb3-type cytochrome oxidase subunit 3
MRLSEIMGGLDLAVYPQAAMVIFLAVFAAVTARTYARGRREEWARHAAMPLEPEAGSGGSEVRS